MKTKFQFAKWLALLGLCAALAGSSFAQRGGANWQQNRPPKDQGAKQQRQQERQQQKQQTSREAQRNANRPPQANAPRGNTEGRPGENRPINPNRPNSDTRSNNPNRPPNAYTPPPRTATPQERQKNEQRFNRLPPQQKQEIRKRADVWSRLTPEQRSHIKNDIAPKWQQLPLGRQNAIQSRLNVLQSMPESARNQHLNDPNFTRGMSEEDKAMLRDLAHMHIGGAPEEPPPTE